MTTLIVSPHLDDAVLSCGQLIAAREGTVVVTVLAGGPPDPKGCTAHDRRSGFVSSGEAVEARRAEDRRACGALDADVVHLGFVEGQYGDRVDARSVYEALIELVDELRPDAIFGPVGVEHDDHRAVAAAYARLAAARTVASWAYEEVPYRVLYPEQVHPALQRFSGFKPTLDRTLPSAPLDAKRWAVGAYGSQLWGLPRECLWVPERYWRLRPSSRCDA